jgi:tetratricopeptide (TPR) repeat protein
VRLKPEDVPLAIHLINTMLESNDPAGAVETAQALTKRYPGYAQGYVLYAIACQAFPPSSPEYRKAEEAFLNALRLEPTNSLAHARLGSLYNAKGDAKRAVEHLEAAWILYYERSSLLYQLSVAYRALGKTEDADRAFQSFNHISKLENELSALQKKRGMEPHRADLSQQIEQTNALLSQAKRAFARGRHDKFGLNPPQLTPRTEGRTP